MSQLPVSTDESAFIRSELERIPGMTPRARTTLETLPLDRDVLTQMVNNLIEDTNTLEGEPFVTWDMATALLTGSRLLADSENVTFAHDGATVSADLTDTGVDADAYGSASKLIVLAIDAKGRVTSASEVALNSDNVAEGGAHLFFTDARARAALSDGAHIDYDNGTGIIAFDGTGINGTFANPTSITVSDGLITAIS